LDGKSPPGSTIWQCASLSALKTPLVSEILQGEFLLQWWQGEKDDYDSDRPLYRCQTRFFPGTIYPVLRQSGAIVSES